MIKNRVYSVQNVVTTLRQALCQYIEARYHIYDESLIRERKKLLEQPVCISQKPFLESTPVYLNAKPYQQLDLPPSIQQLLTQLAELKIGIPPQPYTHQAQALGAFISQQQNIIVSTGTGSGKTETFLMPILSNLALESKATSSLPGCRALLLYPMNALVNDQLARLRKLFGDEQAAMLLQQQRGKAMTFGMYTGRTPYPSKKSKAKDKERLKPLFDKLYGENAGLSEQKQRMLVEQGKWPAKDMRAFEANGYSTQPNDREYFTRHEIQTHCPDILVTNYSMLEYMLLRPIERNIFDQTKAWLDVNPNHYFTVVLDEAHIYRGAAGAEVALLLRRLQSRLGLSQERIRYILTSASLGNDNQATQEKILTFAAELSGQSVDSFTLIKGQHRPYSGAQPATVQQAQQLSQFNLADFQQQHENFAVAKQAIQTLVSTEANDIDSLKNAAFSFLDQYPPATLLLELSSGKAIHFEQLKQQIFPKVAGDCAHKATEALLALATFAKRQTDGKVFAPLRLHLFFRGLNGLYACINPNCDQRLDQESTAPLLGRLYAEHRLHCDCGGRVYELLAHRECGSVFIRGYLRSQDGNFLWHQPSQMLSEGHELIEIHLLVTQHIHDKAKEGLTNWLHIPSGRLIHFLPENTADYLKIYRAEQILTIRDKAVLSFKQCPVCIKTTYKEGYRQSKIGSLATQRETSFAHLIKTQVQLQPENRPKNIQYPNAGRKSLLFSDGRQQAARLARNIPREVEWDTFRQVLLLAVKQLQKEAKPTWALFLSFLKELEQHHLYLFDGEDREKLLKALKRFEQDYDSDLELAIEEWETETSLIPKAYQQALLRQLGESHYSLTALTLAFLVPTRSVSTRIAKALPFINKTELETLSILWISHLLDDFAFDQSLSNSDRNHAAGHYRQGWGSNGQFKAHFRKKLQNKYGQDNGQKIENTFKEYLADQNGTVYFLRPQILKFQLQLNEDWYQCQQCTVLSPVNFDNYCANCGHEGLTVLAPDNSEYLRARKGFWRDPVVAILNEEQQPFGLEVEEHTAQLSHRDTDDVNTTVEEFELRFRDVLLNDKDLPVDVLSSTTTMEVGVDIGSLIAVGLRNVPPQRQNYQQRAGRAGRRGAAISTVITYARNSAYDAYYFNHPEKIITGIPPLPAVDINNPHIICRHVHALLLQAFFHEKVSDSSNADLLSSLGETQDFFQQEKPFSFSAFKQWLPSDKADKVLKSVNSWFPNGLANDFPLKSIVAIFIKELECIQPNKKVTQYLIDYLFDHALLPSYSFPLDLCAFQIETGIKDHRVKIQERPQQAMDIALSEYAPGRLVVVNKKTYRIRTVAANHASNEINRAKALFDNSKAYIFCPACAYVQKPKKSLQEQDTCPLCQTKLESRTMITPEVVFAENKKPIDELDDDQIFSVVSNAQLPDLTGDHKPKTFGKVAHLIHARKQLLVMVNKGHNEEGFQVCEQCGYTDLTDLKAKPNAVNSSHCRDYNYTFSKNAPPPDKCNGNFRDVFLGHDFLSDVLLLRFPRP